MSQDLEPYRHPFRAMGSPCHVTLYARSHSAAMMAGTRVEQEVRRIESLFSRYLEDSALSCFNREAHGVDGYLMDEEMAGLIDYATTCHQQSEGKFDITSGILRQAWRFDGSTIQLPDRDHIASLLPAIGLEYLTVENKRARFQRPGMEIDFGGIGKEYAVDRACGILIEMGYRHAVVNFGGDLRVVGPKPDDTPWEIGIHHPRKADTVLATLEIREGAVATSGDYERSLLIEGVRYSHLLDPRTGWPVRGLASVSVVAPLALIAGSASTIGMLMGQEGPDWLSALGLPCLWVDESGKIGEYRVSNEGSG